MDSPTYKAPGHESSPEPPVIPEADRNGALTPNTAENAYRIAVLAAGFVLFLTAM